MNSINKYGMEEEEMFNENGLFEGLIEFTGDLNSLLDKISGQCNDRPDVNVYSPTESPTARLTSILDRISNKSSNIFTEFSDLFTASISEKKELAEFLEHLLEMSGSNGLSKYSECIKQNLERVNILIKADLERISSFAKLQNKYLELSNEFSLIYDAIKTEQDSTQQKEQIKKALLQMKSRLNLILTGIFQNIDFEDNTINSVELRDALNYSADKKSVSNSKSITFFRNKNSSAVSIDDLVNHHRK